jgi:hypothetical protein
LAALVYLNFPPLAADPSPSYALSGLILVGEPTEIIIDFLFVAHIPTKMLGNWARLHVYESSGLNYSNNFTDYFRKKSPEFDQSSPSA